MYKAEKFSVDRNELSLKDKADYIKDIEKAKKLIQEKEAAIQKNDADQAAKQQQISIQQQIIETVKTKRATLN